MTLSDELLLIDNRFCDDVVGNTGGGVVAAVAKMMLAALVIAMAVSAAVKAALVVAVTASAVSVVVLVVSMEVVGIVLVVVAMTAVAMRPTFLFWRSSSFLSSVGVDGIDDKLFLFVLCLDTHAGHFQFCFFSFVIRAKSFSEM